MTDSPQHPDFWDARYRTGRTPWNLGRVPARLERYLAEAPAGGRVLLPGCGHGWELAAFVHAGYDATALDFSASAVVRARAVLDPELAGRVRLGDFFTEDLPGGPFDILYERTFLCSLPPALRGAYGRRGRALLRPGGRLLGFFYFGTGPGGPP